MKVGLVCCEFRNNDPDNNIDQVEKMLINNHYENQVLCFGEAFLQGFDALSWDFEEDRKIACSLDSERMQIVMHLAQKYETALLFGWIELDQQTIYSSCALIDPNGKLVSNYRRISKGWKEFSRTDQHYKEGNEIITMHLENKSFAVALCGDLWDFPERFKTDLPVIWPVFVDYTKKEWLEKGLSDYCKQAAMISNHVLLVNSIDQIHPAAGGCFEIIQGKLGSILPFEQEGILSIEI